MAMKKNVCNLNLLFALVLLRQAHKPPASIEDKDQRRVTKTKTHGRQFKTKASANEETKNADGQKLKVPLFSKNKECRRDLKQSRKQKPARSKQKVIR